MGLPTAIRCCPLLLWLQHAGAARTLLLILSSHAMSSSSASYSALWWSSYTCWCSLCRRYGAVAMSPSIMGPWCAAASLLRP